MKHKAEHQVYPWHCRWYPVIDFNGGDCFAQRRHRSEAGASGSFLEDVSDGETCGCTPSVSIS
jgi:hypothetical protein